MKPKSLMMKEGQLGSLLVSAFFMLAGVVTLYDTTGYTDRDSQVFPQTVAIILLVTATISFVTRLLRPTSEGGFGTGIWWRRLLLLGALFLTCFLIPKIGFLAAGLIAFSGGLCAAMHDRWTKKNVILYFGSGATLIVGFYALFKFALYVPLP